MPPPSSVDAWLNGRRFGIVIDAGSSGSRLQIYSWRDARLVRTEQGPKAYYSLPEVGKGTENAQDWVRKVEPGISSFGENPGGVASHLAPLLDHAREHIPPSLHHETPIFLLATAGMRLLPTSQQTAVLNAACDFIRFHSHFRVDGASVTGHCGSSVRIISGEEEGLFGWIAVNYLMDQFTGNDDDSTTYGFLDMGGASTQIAFEPSEEERAKTKNLIDVHLRLIGGEEVHHQVFVTTWLGYGTNQARERYVERVIARHEPSITAEAHDPLPDPCLPRNLQLPENSSAHTSHGDAKSNEDHTLIGTGSFEQCLEEVAPLLNKDVPCPDVPCLFNGVHVPQIDFSISHFIGVSEYWYSSEHVFGLGGAYNFGEFERAASQFCSREWDDILRRHSAFKANGALGGDGEVEENGQVVGVGKWGDEVEVSRLQMQCFKSAWLVNVLHDGIGLPRIVDPDGNSRENSDNVKEKAKQKGLGKATMQTLDSIRDTSITWTLGKMVLEASREVPPLSKNTPPLPEPVVDIGLKEPHNFVDFDQMASPTLSPLPTERYGLELFHFQFFLFLVCFAIVTIIAFRLRHSISHCLRAYLSRLYGKRVPDDDLEGGTGRNSRSGRLFTTNHIFTTSLLSPSYSRLWTPTRSWLSRVLATIRSPATSSSSSSPAGRHMYSSSSRASPKRSSSSPSLRYQNGSAGTGHHGGGLFGGPVPPRATTPPTHRLDATQPNGHSIPPLYSLPRSRNNSQMNLTMLVTRQPVSRSGSSGQQTPIKACHDGD